MNTPNQTCIDSTYHALLRHVMATGEDSTDRTGVGTRRVFGYQIRHDCGVNFPLLTTKKVHFKSVAYELLFFLKGLTNVKWLQANGVTIWNEWADENGELGPVYGKQWRAWEGFFTGTKFEVDQVKNLIETIRKSPDSRRMIVSAWNPVDVPHMKLPPCHTLWQCVVSNERRLNLHLYARSIDSFLGLPFNIASYALLLSMLARVTNTNVGDLVISFGDLHIYRNHFAQVEEQLARTPRTPPLLNINKERSNIDEFQFEDFDIFGYDPHPAIKAPIAV